MKKIGIALFLILFLLIPKINRAIPSFQFASGNIIQLDHPEWLFYYGHTYKEISNDTTLKGQNIKVPSPWGYLGHPNTGYGTYVLKFNHNLEKGNILSLKLLTIGTSYNLYVNGKPIYKVGVFSTNPEESQPDYESGLVDFMVDSATIELALEVANFHYREGGFFYMPTIAMEHTMEKANYKTLFTELFLCGALFVLFCYFVVFYYIKTDQKSSLLFAFVCLFAVLRIISTGDLIIRSINLPISWDILVKTEYISLVLMLLFGVLYLTTMFPKDANRKVVKIIMWVQGLIAVFFLLAPVKIGSYFIPYYLFVCALLAIYLLNLIIKVIYMRRPFALFAGGAYLFVFFAAINDILYSQGLIKSIYLMPTAIFIFAIVQALTITRIFSAAFKEVESLSNRLKNINKNQKEIIHERTSLLNMQAQELQRSNQIKDKVFSIISHDLRAPIKSLSTVLAWVADDDLTFDELKKSLGSISKNVDTLNLTLENLLQWSRNQLNGVNSEPELIDIRKPFQDLLDLYKIQLGEKNISFKMNVQERIVVYIDKHHLNLLLRNLISNAIKFTHDNGVISVNAQNYNKNQTLISIQDDGVGMSQEAIEKVFSATDHYTTYGTNNEKGTGLGLLLCKEYVESSGGKIWIESAPNKGTSVCFTLPNDVD